MARESHHPAPRVTLTLLGAAVVVAGVWWALNEGRTRRAASTTNPATASNAPATANAKAAAAAGSSAALSVDELLRAFPAAPGRPQNALADLRTALRALPPAEASQR